MAGDRRGAGAVQGRRTGDDRRHGRPQPSADEFVSCLSAAYWSGKLRPLGVTDTQRTPLLPDVPTIAEAGVPGYQAANWWGIAVPAGTPQPIVAKLTRPLRRCSAPRCEKAVRLRRRGDHAAWSRPNSPNSSRANTKSGARSSKPPTSSPSRPITARPGEPHRSVRQTPLGPTGFRTSGKSVTIRDDCRNSRLEMTMRNMIMRKAAPGGMVGMR